MERQEDGYYLALDREDEVQVNAYMERGKVLTEKIIAALEADSEVTLSVSELADLHTVLRGSAESLIALMQQVSFLEMLLQTAAQASPDNGPDDNPFTNPFKFGN